MMGWSIWLLSVPAFAALSLAMDKHHEQVFGQDSTPLQQWRWRAVGVLLLALSLVVSLHYWATSVAVVAWLGGLTFAALSVGVILTYAPHRLRLLALLCGLLGVWVSLISW